jgi:hypothetical protein
VVVDDERLISVEFPTTMLAEGLEEAIAARVPGAEVAREGRRVSIRTVDEADGHRAERTVKRYIAEYRPPAEVVVRWRDQEPRESRTKHKGSAAPDTPADDGLFEQERIELVWIDAESLRWEVHAHFPDEDAACAQAARLRNSEPLAVYWLRGRTLSVYTTTEEEATRIAGDIEAPTEAVRPLTRRRAWLMRLHLAGNYDTSSRWERHIVQREWAAAAVGGEQDLDLDLGLDVDVDLDIDFS